MPAPTRILNVFPPRYFFGSCAELSWGRTARETRHAQIDYAGSGIYKVESGAELTRVLRQQKSMENRSKLILACMILVMLGVLGNRDGGGEE